MALLFWTIKKRKSFLFFVWNKEAKMIVLLLGAPIQNPKMIAALKMKSLGFWVFSSVLFSKLRSGQKYAMLTAQSSSCIKQGACRREIFKCFKMFTPHIVWLYVEGDNVCKSAQPWGKYSYIWFSQIFILSHITVIRQKWFQTEEVLIDVCLCKIARES